MTATLIGYARCSTDKQDLTAQRQALAELGVAPNRIYMDKGLTGTNRARPGLDQAMAAVRKGDTLVVPKLDRLVLQLRFSCYHGLFPERKAKESHDVKPAVQLARNRGRPHVKHGAGYDDCHGLASLSP